MEIESLQGHDIWIVGKGAIAVYRGEWWWGPKDAPENKRTGGSYSGEEPAECGCVFCIVRRDMETIEGDD